MDKVNFYVQPYQYNAFADYIIQGHECYEEWINNQFVEMIGMNSIKEDIIITIDYLSGNIYGKMPLLSIIDYSYMKNQDREGSIKKISEGVKSGKKYYVFVDHFYMPNARGYQKRHSVHDVLIIKNEDGIFHYLENVDGFIKEYEIPVDEFFEIFYAHDIECIYELDIDKESKYYFDIKTFRTMLEDYVTGRDVKDHWDIYLDNSGFYSSEFFDARLNQVDYWGINVYDLVAKNVLQHAEKKESIDYRTIYIMQEKNQNLISKLNFCVKRGYLKEEDIQEIVEKLKKICARLGKDVRKIYKYVCSGFVAPGMESIAEDIKISKEEEKEIYNSILDLLSEYK